LTTMNPVSLGIREQFPKSAQPRLVTAPARDRRPVDRLPCLPHASGPHRASVTLGVKTRIIPIQAAELDHFPAHRFAIGDQLLVLDFEETVPWQHVAPMGHQPEILTISGEKVAAVVSKIDPSGKILEVDRQTSSTRKDRVPLIAS